MTTGPSQAVIDALDALGTAIGGEPFEIFVAVRDPESDWFATTANFGDPQRAQYILETLLQRVRSGDWQRERQKITS